MMDGRPASSGGLVRTPVNEGIYLTHLRGTIAQTPTNNLERSICLWGVDMGFGSEAEGVEI